MSRTARGLYWGRGLTVGTFVVALAASAAILLAALPAAHAASPVTTKSEGFQTRRPTAALLDPDSNSFLFEKNSDQPFRAGEPRQADDA